MKRMISLTIWLVFLAWATGLGQVKIVQWRDSSGTLVPMRAIPLKLNGSTPLTFTGSITKGLDFGSVTPVYTSQENAYLAIGTYTSAITVADNGASFIPIQVNLSSTGNVASPGNQVAAARLRVDADATGTNTALSCLQLRSDIGANVYASTLISASTNISADVSIPTATLQGFYVAITGNKSITCPNNVNVIEAVYKQTSGGGGVDNVAELASNASDCSLTNIVNVVNYAGTVTNGINITGAMTNGINVSGTYSGSAINIAAGKIKVAGLTIAAVDSFLTTATIDTVVVSGIATTDVFAITGKTFAYSTAVDSVTYSYRLNTDTLFVSRVHLTPIGGGGAVKSGGQYSFIRIAK